MGVTTDISFVQDNIESWGVSLDVPSLTPANLDGGTGSISFTTGDLTQPQLLRKQRFTLTDDDAGAFIGRVSQISWSEGGASFTAETSLHRLNVEASVSPQKAELDEAISEILFPLGLVPEGLPPDTVRTIPGWFGNLLDYFKHFCVVFDLEMLPHHCEPDRVVFRPVRGMIFNQEKSNLQFSIDDQQLAQTVEVVNYSYGEMTDDNVEFTPATTPDAQILTVNAGETISFEIELNAWVSTVNQPEVLDLVGPDSRTDEGAYCVAGADGLPIPASQWTAQGGKLEVEIGGTPSKLKVTLTAPQTPTLFGEDGKDRFAPYAIAATAGDGVLYNSLHITGRGIPFRRENVVVPTGVESEVTVEKVGVTIDNPWARNLDIAYRLGVRAAQTYAGPNYRLTSYGSNSSQPLRNILGARVEGQDVHFRVLSASLSESGLDVSGEMDVTFDDLEQDAVATFNQLDTLLEGLSFDEWAVTPIGGFCE